MTCFAYNSGFKIWQTLMIQEVLIPLISLIALEIILGIDNLIFISILSDKLPAEKRSKLRFMGISLALIIRLLLLTAIAWILKLDNTLFTIFKTDISGKSLILIIGGLFLIYKSTKEIHHKTQLAQTDRVNTNTKTHSFKKLLTEIVLLDIVFSIDSVITAIGMVTELWIMYTAVIVSLIVMLFAAKSLNNFIGKNPSFQILALCFLMMIGVALLGEGLHFEIPKGYIFFSMAFAFLVDIIQMKIVKKGKSEPL